MTDPLTWKGWGSILGASEKQERGSILGASEKRGIGFVLTADDQICCVDLDHALDADGTLLPWAGQLLEGCPATWVEVSPSGRGLHVWGYGHVGRGRRVRVVGGGGVEVYDRGRYITVTGNRFDGAPLALANIAGWLGRVLDQIS